jgi:hypothetical protein
MTATTNKTVWVRKRQVRERYGNCSDSTIDRMVESGKLPPPQHPFGNKIPFGSLAELDASDKAAAAAYRAATKQKLHNKFVQPPAWLTGGCLSDRAELPPVKRRQQ